MKAESIEYVLDQLGGDGSYGRSGDHLMSNCVHAPWGHHSGVDRDTKLGIMVQDGMSPLNCFYPGCLPDGSKTLLGLVQLVGGKRVGDSLMSPEQLSALKAFVIMAEEDDDVAADPNWGAARPKEVIPQNILDACNGTAPYWVSRGISQETATEWKLGQDEFRAHMPFLDQSGAIMAVQGRLLPGVARDNYPWDKKGHDEKYRSLPAGFERAEILVGEHLITKPVDWLLVVESPFDAIALTDWLRRQPAGDSPADNGTWAVVATMGGEVAAQHAQKMVDFVSADGELVLGMDMDHAGRYATRQLVGMEKQFAKHSLYRRIARISEVEWKRKDPTDLGVGEFSVTLDQARQDAIVSIRDRENSLTKLLTRIVA